MSTTKAKVQEVETKRGRSPALPSSVMGFLSKTQVAEALSVSTRTVDRLISAGKLEKGLPLLGSEPKWTVSYINEWCAAVAARKGI